MKTLRLKAGRQKSLLRRHPWIFSGAVATVTGEPEPGETVLVLDAAGTALGTAAYSPQSQIRARIWSFDPDLPVDEEFFDRRLRTAIAARDTWNTQPEPAGLWLVHAENYSLPGVIVDRYG